jgi:lipopolysaccharide export system protein LptC
MTRVSVHLDRRIVIPLVLAGAAALSWWWSEVGEMPRLGAPPAGETESDYSFRDLAVSEMGPDGGLTHTLSADELEHYPDRASSLLVRPRLAFYQDGGKTWDIAARSGVVEESDRSVLLSGDVRVDYGAAQGRGFELYTEELRVWPDARRAETEKAVKIVQSAGVIESIGLKAELDTRRLSLLSQVRGVYEP